jgi:hypothetical protein
MLKQAIIIVLKDHQPKIWSCTTLEEDLLYHTGARAKNRLAACLAEVKH